MRALYTHWITHGMSSSVSKKFGEKLKFLYFAAGNIVTKIEDWGADIASNGGSCWLKTDLYHAELHLHWQRKRQINSSQSIHQSVKLLWLWSFWAFVCLIFKSCALCAGLAAPHLREGFTEHYLECWSLILTPATRSRPQHQIFYFSIFSSHHCAAILIILIWNIYTIYTYILYVTTHHRKQKQMRVFPWKIICTQSAG